MIIKKESAAIPSNIEQSQNLDAATQPIVGNALTPGERLALDRFFEAYFQLVGAEDDAGKNLVLISELKLYREHFENFAQFCDNTIGGYRADQLLGVADAGSPRLSAEETIDEYEKQARVLAKVSKEERDAILAKTIGYARTSVMGMIEEAVERILKAEKSKRS